MSRTWKDRPYRLGGSRHRWLCCDSGRTHAQFVRIMSRLRRRAEMESLRRHGEVPKRTRHRYKYFD